jgi:uncharacterized RDD family membrane protein YckC
MQTTISKNEVSPKFIYATFWERCLAFCLDNVMLWILLAFLGNLLNEKPDHIFIGIVCSIKGSVLTIIVSWLYFALQESSVHQGSIGKRAFKLYVADTTGHRISFGKATLRHFAKCISYLILLIGFFMMLWDKGHQTLHDRIAGTLVLK